MNKLAAGAAVGAGLAAGVAGEAILFPANPADKRDVPTVPEAVVQKSVNTYAQLINTMSVSKDELKAYYQANDSGSKYKGGAAGGSRGGKSQPKDPNTVYVDKFVPAGNNTSGYEVSFEAPKTPSGKPDLSQVNDLAIRGFKRRLGVSNTVYSISFSKNNEGEWEVKPSYANTSNKLTGGPYGGNWSELDATKFSDISADVGTILMRALNRQPVIYMRPPDSIVEKQIPIPEIPIDPQG